MPKKWHSCHPNVGPESTFFVPRDVDILLDFHSLGVLPLPG